MSEMKSLADQLRQQMSAAPAAAAMNVHSAAKKVDLVKPEPEPPPAILQEILNYDTSANKAMVHVKLDPDTAKLLGHLKMATGIDNIKLVAFSVRHLFATQPELKTFIKNFILNFDL